MKKSIGPKNVLYPTLTTLVGAQINGKPNYLTIAWVGIVNRSHLSISLGKSHFTNQGIRKNKTFSVNIPPIDLVKETDYCGLVSGKNVDKSGVFKTFYGKLETAPMIEECPINLECRLVKTVDFPGNELFIGEIVETYCEEEVFTEDYIDFAKVQPLLYITTDKSYWKLDNRVAKAYEIGKELKSGE